MPVTETGPEITGIVILYLGPYAEVVEVVKTKARGGVKTALPE